MASVNEIVARQGARLGVYLLGKYAKQTVRTQSALPFGTAPLGVEYPVLENPDEVLNEFAPYERVRMYRRMRRQVPIVGGLCKVRIDAALHLPHVITAGAPEDDESRRITAEVSDGWFNGVQDRDAAQRKLMMCIFDGYSVAFYQWGTHQVTLEDSDAMLTMPIRIADQLPEAFGFDDNGRLWLRTDTTNGNPDGKLIDDPFQYVVGRYGSADYYGEAELKDAYVDVWKHDMIDKFGLDTLERQGWPLIQIIVPESLSTERIAEIRSAAIKTYKNVMVIPSGDRFEITQGAGASAVTFVGADQIERLAKLEDSISIALLGVAFSNSQVGSMARDQVRNELRFEKTAGDAAVYDALANDWITKVMLVNYPNVPRYKWPRCTTDTKPTDDLKLAMDIMMQASEMGFPVSLTSVASRFGLVAAENDDDLLKKVGSADTNAANAQATSATAEGDAADVSAASVLPVSDGAPDAGLTTSLTLTAQQITAAMDVAKQLRSGAIGELFAINLLIGGGIPRDQAEAMVKETMALGVVESSTPPVAVPPPLPFQRRAETITVMNADTNNFATFDADSLFLTTDGHLVEAKDIKDGMTIVGIRPGLEANEKGN